MAEKLYGGAYLSRFVDAVLDNLSSILEEDDSVLSGNYSALELLERLQNCLYDVAPVLDDAELKQFTDKRVKKWLVDLQDALYFADDFLDELSTKAAIAPTQRDPAPQLEDLTLMYCPEIELCPTGDGDPHRSLRHIFIRHCDKLVSSAAFMNSQFHGLTHLTIQYERECVTYLPKEGWLPASLQSLRLSGMKSMETLECKGLAHLTSLQQLTIWGCPKLENIEGEKLPASLIQLTIYECPLLGVRCQMKDPQVWPKISHIHAIVVDHGWIW